MLVDLLASSINFNCLHQKIWPHKKAKNTQTTRLLLAIFVFVRLIWNPSNCECECDKSCDTGEYLDYKNCKRKKKLVDKFFEESDVQKILMK